MLPLLLLGAVLPLTQQEPDLGAGVRTLFEAKCLHCHHPDSEDRKAKREFDEAYDLRAVAREWGDDLDPEFAPLFEIAEDRSMPPKDSDFEPMTEAESDLLRAWTLARTPMPEDGNPFVDLAMAALHQEKAAPDLPTPKERGFVERAWLLLGRLHAPVVHFPVAFLILAGILRIATRLRPSVVLGSLEHLCLLLGAPSAVLASALGWINAANSGAGGEELFWHRWIGVGTAALSVLLLILHRRAGTRRWYTLLLMLLCVALAFGAHKGGVLVFGEAYFRL